MDQNGEVWETVASYFEDRSDVQCQHRWTKVVNPQLVKGPWTKEVGTFPFVSNIFFPILLTISFSILLIVWMVSGKAVYIHFRFLKDGRREDAQKGRDTMI